MDFLSNPTKTEESKPKPTSDHKSPSKSALLSSAKVLADTAQSHLRHEPAKHDKAKVAGAAADILCAASEYGHLDEKKGVGKYVDQAEDYLRKYGHKTPPSNSAHDAAKPHKSGGGHGDFMKMAGDFLKK